MGNKCCKSQSSTYSSVNPTIRSFSSYDSSIARTTGNHAITFGIPTRGNSLTTLTMKSSNNSDVGKDYRGGSSSTIGQEDSIPVFLRRLNDLNIRVGSRTRLLIELDNPSGVQVRWFHNNLEAESDRYQYIYEGGFYCLDIVPVTLEDEGLWVCSAQNYIGKSSTAAHLSLIVPKAFKKPIFVEQLRAVLTQRGIVSLECKVIGVPTPKLRWYKDDKEIKAGDIFALTANSNDDCLGIYTCEATNVMGTALSTSKIQVTHTQFGEKCNVDSLIPYGPSPKFLKVLKNAFGKIGNSLFLECQVEVPPWPQSIGWYNDSGIINEGPLYHLIADGLGMYGIEIKSLRADHNATWKCVATSSTGAKAITSCKVSVSYPKNYRVPRFLESLRAIMTDEGLVSFECKVIGYPTPQLLWFKDGTQLQPGDVYELTGSKSLGSYCCVAQNCMGEASSLAELTMEDIQNQLNESEKLQLTSNTQPPRFLLGLKSTETNINEPFVFMVKVTTESTPTITWYKEDVQLTESNRYQFSSEENSTFILNIVPVEMEDEAEWKCVAINKFGQTVTSSFLKLNIPKNFKLPRFLEELRIAFSNEGSVNLECKVIGVPQPQLKWFKDGQEINPGDMHKIISGKSGTCCLGTYTCQAHNCMGTVSSSATLLTMEDKSTVKSCASDEYLSVVNPLVRNESLSTIFEERTSQMEKSYTIEEPADISFSFDGKEVTVSLYETPDLTHDEALQIIEMYADELSEHISEDNIVDLPSLRIVKETSISGPVMMEALVIDVPTSICKKHTQSDTDFDGVSLTEDNTLANIDKSDSMCDNSLEYFSDHLSSSNSKRDIFYSASETTPKNVSLKQQSEDGGHLSFQTPNNFMLNSDDQILTQLNLKDKLKPQIVQNIIGPLVRSESNNTEEEVSEILAEVDDELPITQNYCPAEIVTNYEEDGLVVFDKIQNLTIEGFSDEIENLKVDSRSNIDEFLNNMKIILECSMIKMCKHESCNFKSTPTKLEQSIQSLHSLAWRFIEETNRNHLTEIDKNTANNVSILMTAINASLLALEQVDDPFGVSDNILNEIQSSVCFDFETLNNKELLATDILDHISDEIKNFITVVNRQVATVTEQRIIAVLRNTIGTTLIYIKQLQQSSYTIKCININSFAPLFSMVHPLESILNDIISLEEQLNEDSQSQINLKQMLIPPISSIAFYLDNLNTALKNEYSEGDQDLKDIFDRINDSNNQFKVLTSLGIERNNLAECFISFTKSINDLCCHLRRLGRSNENIVSSDYGSDDKLLLDFETLFDELMIDIDTLTNNVNVVRDSENNMNPLGPLLEPLQDIKIGLFQVNQVLLSNQTGSNMSYEVISCFEHLSQQLVQLNNCIVNQSIVEETNKELPFESSIKMMQNILFNDEIDDLGLNGILFGSVMKPLLQLQNIIVSKMAAVESDLSFSEQTDVTGDGCDTQSLSVSLTKNETVLNKIDNNLKQNVKISSKTDDISDVSEKDSNIIKPSTSKNNYDLVFLENSPKNNFVIKKGFECDIGLAFKDEEPNIITSEDDPENSGFDVLFEETDLETFSDFIEDEYVGNLVQSNVDNNLSSLSLIEVNNHDIENCYNTSKDPLELFDTCIQDNELLNSTIELPDKVEDSLNMIIEEELEKIKERNLLDDQVIYNDSQENESKIIEIDFNESDEFLNINQIKNETNLTSKEYEKNNEILNDITEPVFEKIQNDTAEYVNSEKSEFIKRVNEIDEISDLSPDKTEEVNDLTNLKTPINTFEFISDDEIIRKNENLLDNNDHKISSYIQNEMSKNDERSNMVHDGNLEENTILLNLENKTLNSESINEINKKNISADIISLQNSESFVEKQNEYICVPNTSEIIVNEIVNSCDIKSLNIDTVNNVNDDFIDVELKCLKTIEPSQLINNLEEHFNMENEPTKSYSQNNSINEENNIKINTDMDETIKLLESNNIDKVDEKGNKIMILNDGCNSDLELNKNMESCVEYNNAIKNENDLVVEELNHLNIQEISNKMIINTPILENIIDEDFQEISTNASERIIDDFKESISSLDVNLAKVTENLILHEVIEEKNSIDENNIIMDSNNMSNEVEINKKLNMNNLHPENISKEVINTISLTDDESKYLSNLTAICDGTEELVSKSAVSVSENIIFNQNINNKQCETDNDHDLIQMNSTNISDNLIISDNKKQNDESSDFNLKILTPAHIMNADNLSNLQEDNLENSKQIQDDTIKNINQNEDSLNLQDTVDLIQNIDSKILDQQLINNNDDTKQMISNINVEDVQINDEEKEFTNLDNNNIINEFEIDGADKTSKNITIELNAQEHFLDKKETDTDNNINIKIKDEFNFNLQCKNEANDNINVGDLNKAILYENNVQINDMCDLILPIENENVEVKNLSLLIEENKAIINNEVITVENSQSFDLYKYDEKKVDVKYENENRDNIAFEQITIFNSPNNNLVNSETQQIISLMEGEIDSGIDEFSIIVDNINIDNNNLVNDDTSILEEKYKQIICNDDNQVDSTERLNKADIEIVEEKLENNLQCGKPQKSIILNDIVKIDENLMLTSNVGEDNSCNESLNKEAKNIKNLICKEDENKKIIDMDENIDIETTQSVGENLNVMISDNNEIIKNDSDVLIANDDITQERNESTLMIEPKESKDNSNDEMLINDNYNKLRINTEIENNIEEINSSGISCSYNDNNEIENNDIVIYNSTENNSSSTVENNLALNVTEILKTDCVQMIDHLKCTENILLDDANQNNDVTESALILKDMNTLENDNIKQMSNTINNDITYNVMDESDNITNKLIDPQNKEYNAIDNTEVLNSDNTEPLKKCDIIQESLNEKLTDQLNDSIEISTPNVFQSSISIHEVNSNEDQNEIFNFNDNKSEDIINNTISNITDNSKNKIEPKNTENLINIEDHVLNNNDLDKNTSITNNEYNNLSHDQYLSTVNDIKNIDQNSIDNSKSVSQNIPNEILYNTTELITEECTEKERISNDNSNIINMENEITNIIDRNVINSEQLMYEDESKNEIREDQQEVENNKERDHKNKCHEQISISQNYFIPEDKIYDLPIKEIVNNISVIPKLHHVEHMTANKSENVMLENVNIWENDKNKVKNNIIEKAQIEHELNIAAIVNIVKDFDSIKENTVSSNVDKQNLLENAILTTIDKHTTDIMLKYVDILEAPSEDTILKEENVLTDEKQNEFTEKVNTNIMKTSNEDILEKDIFIDDKLKDTREKENIDILKETNDDSIKEQENVLSEEKLNKYTEKENNDILKASSKDIAINEENILTDEKLNDATEKESVDIFKAPSDDLIKKEKKVTTDENVNESTENLNVNILKASKEDIIMDEEDVLTDNNLNNDSTEKVNIDILKVSSKDTTMKEENIITVEERNNATEKENVDILKAPSDDLIKKEKKVPTDENVNESTENANVDILKASKEDIIMNEEDVLTDNNLNNDSTEKVNIDILKVSSKDTTMKEENILTVEEQYVATEKENVDILKSPRDDLIKKEKKVPTDENVNESTENANVDNLKASSDDLKKKKISTDEKLNEFTDNMNKDILKAPNKNKIIKEENVLTDEKLNDSTEKVNVDILKSSNENIIMKEEIVLNDDKLECDTENKNVDILKETNVNESLKSNIENEQFLNKEHNLIEVKNDNLILENIINEHEKDTINENLSPEFNKCSNISKNKNIEEEKINTKILKESVLNDEDNSCELELQIREKKESNVENNVDAIDIKLATEISPINDHCTPKLIQNENNKCVVEGIEQIISNNNHLESDKINNKIESISKKEDSEKIKKNRGSKKNKTNLQPQHEVLMSKEISSIQNNKNIEKNINSFENDTVSQYELLDEYKKDNKEMVNIKEKSLIDPMEKIESTLNIININTIDDNNIENSEKNNINSSNLLQNEIVIDNVENNTPQQHITENKERKKNDAILKEHETQKEMKKRGNKKKRSSLQDKKSPSPDKSINISSDKNNEIDYQIKKNENTNMIEDTIFNKNVLDEIKEENKDEQSIVQKPIITQNKNPNFILHESLVCVNKNNNNIWTNEKDISNVSHINIKNEHLISRDVFVDKVTKATDRKVLNFSDFKSNSKTLPSISIIKPMKSDYDFDRHPTTRYLDVTDAHRSHTKPLTSRSLTPEPRRISESIKYSYSSDRDINRHCGSGRSLSPYPEPSVRQNIDFYSTRNRWLATYRSSCRLEDENLSYTSYGAMKRRGSDSFLHDSGARNSAYYSSRRFPENVSSFSSATCIDDLTRTKEIFKRLSFCVRLMDQTVSSGTRVKFWCSIIGYPEPRVQWYRDGQRLNSFAHNSSTRYQSRYINGLAQLIVENAQSCDSGEYTCVATNSRDRISTTGYLTVYTSPLVFGATPNRRCLSMEGFKHSALTDRPYLWTNNDNLRSNFTYKYNNNDWRLSENISSRCPRYPKFVTSIIADDIATYGGTIALQVRIQGSPLPNVTWLRETNPLPRSSNKYIYLDEGGLFTLLVKDSTNKDSGTYVCRACNLYGTADVEKSVRVVSLHDYSERRGVKPAIIVSRPNDRLNVAVGEDITVTLRVAGEPKPKVIWMKGSRDVTFIDRSLKETVNDYVKLSIKKAQLSDAGTYFIIAKNVYGSDRAFVTVGVKKRARSLTPPQIRNSAVCRWPLLRNGDVTNRCSRRRANNEVPGPIRSEPIVADRANNRISLTWEKPEKEETILVFRVEVQSTEELCWKQVGMTPTNSIDVYNLKPGYRYKFRVTARNRFGWGQSVDTTDYVDILEPKNLPEFHQPLPGETKVLLHHNTVLQCHVRGIPKPQVTWYKDGEPLQVTEKYTIDYTERGKCTLTITRAVDEDSGRYSCEAINDQGRVCTLTVVEVMSNRRLVEAERRLQGCLMKDVDFKESAPKFTKRLIDRRVEINSTVRLSCQVNGLPLPSIMWYKDGQQMKFTDNIKKPILDSDNFSTLELIDVKYDDIGEYKAVASNSIGSTFTCCLLEVINKNHTDLAIPEFVYDLPPNLETTGSIDLKAQIDAYRPVKVEWFRDELPLRNGRRADIITDHDGKLELRIAEVTKRDSGTYTLRVSNDTGTIESRCDVNVVENKHDETGLEQISLTDNLYSEKPKFVVKPKFQEVEEGEEVIIDSEIVGDPLPKVTWLRDGLKPEYYRDNSEFLCISNGNRHQLKIPHAKLTHTGTYTLLAANPHGQIKTLISLQVYSPGHRKKKTMINGINNTTVERLPRISRGLVDIECCENDSVVFECKLNITQETDVRWKKDGRLVRLGKEIKSELVNGDTACLKISTVSPLHEGLYTCIAYNELGQNSTSARLILSNSQNTKSILSNGKSNTMLSSPILADESNCRNSKRLKRSSAPKFYAVLHDKTAEVGDSVRFQCSVTGYPPPWSSWEKDGELIGINSRMRIREDDDNRSLEICDVTSDDAGLYRITVENKYGKIHATARLEVWSHHQTNDVQITSSTDGRRQSGSAACAGDNFTLSCDIRGNPMSDVTWYKNDEEINDTDSRVTSSRDDLAARLSISNLELADTGVYTCVARNDSGVTRCSTELCVFDTKLAKDSYLQPPIFVEGLVPKRTVDEGERIELTVKLQGAVPMRATWFKDDVLVPDCEDFTYVTGEYGKFGLSIADPFSADSGTYSCKVINKFGEAVSNGELVINETTSDEFKSASRKTTDLETEFNNNLNVQEKTISDSAPENESTASPATILWGPCDTTVLRGARIVLETSYAGNPEPCIQWFKAGKTLESDGHLCITKADGISSLTIDSITADDCGKYGVQVDNGLGSDYHFASVAVEGPPDPPAGRPIVSVSETSADVTWSSPAYDGGCMVTGYSVEVRPFNQSDWKLVADKCYSLSHVVRGLAPGESYVFRVRAENMHGSSEASSESVPVYILQTDYGNTIEPKKVSIENGELFTEQYEVLDELGKGRYGVVYKVKERETSKYYAAKFVRCIKAKDKEKAKEEVDVMNCLRHPKLLQLNAAFDNPREVVMVTEYISGGELFERVVADDFTLTEKDCILFTRQICEGVDYMHKQNVVHLDLKPENIMCQSRTSHQIKLIDFGLAQIIEPGKPIRVLFGTPEFIPPEIISYEPIGLESDMWSVGVICYVLLSGLSPFMGDNDAETFTNITKAEFDFDDEAFDAISQDAKDFISALLVKRKEKRLNAKECMKHKWLAQQDMDMSCVILSTDKLKKFIIRRKWQKTGNAIRALGRMAILSAASRRSVSGTGSVFQQLKMASLSEEDSAGESSSPSPPYGDRRPSAVLGHGRAAVVAEEPATVNCRTKYCGIDGGGGRRSCDARSDSGISDCSSLASSTAHVRLSDLPSSIAEEEKSPTTIVPSTPDLVPARKTADHPAPVRPSHSPPRPLNHRSKSPARVLLSTGNAAATVGVCETNRLIFDGAARRDVSNSSAGVQRKEAIRIQTADNFKKAVAFWKQ